MIRLFKLNKEVDQFFYKTVLHGLEHEDLNQNKSHRNLLDARGIIFQWLENRQDKIELLVRVMLEQLGFLFYAPQNTREIGIMFEVINNRGKPLSQLEKVKNYLIYFASKNDTPVLKETVDDNWPVILQNLSSCDMISNSAEDSFLYNAWVVFWFDSKSESYWVYDRLKFHFPVESNNETLRKNFEYMHEFVNFLKGVSITYLKLYRGEHLNDPQEIRLMTLIKYQGFHASIMPLLISLYARQDIHQDDRIRFLDIIEKLNFRYYGCNIARRSDSGRTYLFELAYDFFHQKLTVEAVIIALVNFVKNYAPDISVIKNLTLDEGEVGDYFSWGALKYFLANYEEDLLSRQKRSLDFHRVFAPYENRRSNDFYDREHIWALADESVYDDSRSRDHHKFRLGNFALLETTINRAANRASNHSVHDKIKKAYWIEEAPDPSVPEPNTLMMRELPEMYDHVFKDADSKWQRRTWRFWYEINKAFLDERETRLLQFALRRWRVDYDGSKVIDVNMNSSNPGKEKYQPTWDRKPDQFQVNEGRAGDTITM